jgi:hypothetical protein
MGETHKRANGHKIATIREQQRVEASTPFSQACLHQACVAILFAWSVFPDRYPLTTPEIGITTQLNISIPKSCRIAQPLNFTSILYYLLRV